MDKTATEYRQIIAQALGMVDAAANIIYAASMELSPTNVEGWKKSFANVAASMDEKADGIVTRSGVEVTRHPITKVHTDMAQERPDLLANPPSALH